MMRWRRTTRRAYWVVCWVSLSACGKETLPSPAPKPTQASVAAARVRTDSCRDNADCSSDAYCVFEPGLCGRGPVPGTCKPRGADCGAPQDPVCACDGQIYPSASAARCAGLDLDVTGGCQGTVPDRAACGAHYCDAASAYCEIYLSDVFELPSRHTCRPLPAACRPDAGGSPSCACFAADTPCLSFCGPMLTGANAQKPERALAFHLTCQGVHEPSDQR